MVGGVAQVGKVSTMGQQTRPLWSVNE